MGRAELSVNSSPLWVAMESICSGRGGVPMPRDWVKGGVAIKRESGGVISIADCKLKILIFVRVSGRCESSPALKRWDPHGE